MAYNEEVPEGRKLRTFNAEQEPQVVHDSGSVHVLYTPKSELTEEDETEE